MPNVKTSIHSVSLGHNILVCIAFVALSLASGIPMLGQTRIYETNVWVETVAGSGDNGYVDGPAKQARFTMISSIVADRIGNVFVLDVDRYPLIRKISPTGNVTTIGGVLPPIGVPADSSRRVLDIRSNLALDSSGNIYFWNGPLAWVVPSVFPPGLVKLTTAGAMSVIMENVLSPADFVRWIDVDPAGNIFLTRCALHKISPAGSMSIYAGGLLATNIPGGPTCQGQAGTIPPYWTGGAIDIDANGNVVFQNVFGDIQKASPDGIVTNITGLFPGSTINDGPYSLLGVVRNLEVDQAGNIFYGFSGINFGLKTFSVRKISPGGFVSTLSGGPAGYADGPGKDARFSSILLVAFGRPNELYVSEETRIRRVVFDPDSSSPIPIEELRKRARIT